MKTPLLLALSIALASCAVGSDKDNRAPSNSDEQSWQEALNAIPFDPVKDDAPPAEPLASRDLTDMVAGCAGMNPSSRPRGSNCFGLFPEQCGADKAAAHIGKAISADLARQLYNYAVGRLRVIGPKQPVHDDLRYSRLNVHLDEQDRIESVDCY